MLGPHTRLKRRQLLGALAAAVSLPIACLGGDEPPPAPTRVSRGQPRPFLMGFSSLPADGSGRAYEEAFRLAGQSGDVILIQRAPPWSDFIPGGSVSNRTERLTRVEKDLAGRNRLSLFLAVDPLDSADRGRLAAAPANLEGRDFSDGSVRASLVAYTRYLALNYKPAYMAVGVEVDLFHAAKGDAAFRNFQSVYFEAYDAIKAESSGTQVFPTFQYENMLGILNRASPTGPAWSLVSRFEPKLDMLAVSSFPNAVYPVVSQLPSHYYSGLKNRSSKPIALTSIGWSSQTRPGDLGAEGMAEQREYLSRALDQSLAIPASIVIWYLGRDRRLDSDGPDPLAGMGLSDVDGRRKESFLTWSLLAERPPP